MNTIQIGINPRNTDVNVLSFIDEPDVYADKVLYVPEYNRKMRKLTWVVNCMVSYFGEKPVKKLLYCGIEYREVQEA